MSIALVSDKTPPNSAAGPIWRLMPLQSYLHRIGAEPVSHRRASVSQMMNGYPRTVASVEFQRLNKKWKVSASPGYEPTQAEHDAMLTALETANIPEWQPYSIPFNKADLPTPYSTLPDTHLFILRAPYPDRADGDVSNSRKSAFERHPILMIQARVDDAKRGKAYHPLTWCSDNLWYVLEPERLLPVFGLERLPYSAGQVTFLHEGAKAAQAAQDIADAYNTPSNARNAHQEELATHPWAFELAAGVHLGWVGGAQRVKDTDWGELRIALKKADVSRVVIVGDNDAPGRMALPEISERLGVTADHIIFPTTFPPSFDLADRFPEDAPGFAECLQPGTWLTGQSPGRGNKLIPFLTEAGRAEYLFIPEVALYVNTRHPRFAFDKERFNAVVRPLTHAANTAVLVEASYSPGRAVSLTYSPGKPSGIVTDGEGTALNRHQPTSIRPVDGDAGPWLDFLSYLFPENSSREVVAAWCATLIARRNVRMHFGLLLISETQGVGKTTLGDVMAELVGKHNASFPGENDILSPFNEWQAERRLAVINEIYTGHSWKAYNMLKTVLTDRFLTINRKHQRQYKVDNWLHVIACSNSSRPLKLEDGDRRWHVPKVTEDKWPREKFTAFRAWLAAGGYGIIMAWAKRHGTYIEPGQHAPGSEAKADVVAAGRSDAALAVARLAERMADSADGLAVTLRAVAAYGRRVGGGRLNEDNQELAGLLKRGKIAKWARIKVNGSLENVFVNAAGRTMTEALDLDQQNGAVAALIKSPQEILPEDM
jgi:hypothetical protein